MPLSAPVTATAVECSVGRLGRAAAAAMQGIRNNFEDAHILDQDRGVCGVFDGHLGDEAAAFCAERLHLHVLATGEPSSSSLSGAFMACDAELKTALPEGCQAGSTATIALVRDGSDSDSLKVFVASCGDSRAVLWHKGSGKIEATRDHRPNDPSERERIEAAGGTVSDEFDPPRVDGQLACSRALGAFKFKGSGPPEKQKVSSVPEVYEWTAQRGDWLLIGCDGVWDTFSSERVVTEVCKADNTDLGDVLAKTLQLCIDKEADDNLTLLAVELGATAEVPRTISMSAGNFLKTKDKEVLEQYESFSLRFGYRLEKEMKPKSPPTVALKPVDATPGLRFSHLPAPTTRVAKAAVKPCNGDATLLNGHKPSTGSCDLPPLVIVGPSGVGKGTLIERLMKAFPNRFGFSVSHTTRKPRPGEVEGVSYHFVDLEYMQKEVQIPGRFIEYATVHGNMYGTSAASVERVKQRGQINVLDVDVQGAKLIKAASGKDYKFLFIAPPSLDALESRLRGRATETEEKIQTRLNNARGEIAFENENKDFFDHTLVNSDLGLATKELMAVVRRWYPSLVQVVKVSARRSAAFYIRAAREIIADRRDQQAHHSAEVEVVGLGSSIQTAVAVFNALLEDGHEAALCETDTTQVTTSSKRIQSTPRIRLILRRTDAKANR